MAQLKIFKVNALPVTLEPSAMYFIKTTADRFSIYLTDKDGLVIHRSPDSSDVSTVVLAIVNALKGQPGGLASLDLDGNLEQMALSALGIDGQEGDFRSNGNYVWGSTEQFLVATGNGTNDPTRITLFNGMQGLRFRSDRLIQTWVDILIPYDYALGTVVYPCLQWMVTTNNGNVCRWGLEYSAAKGHGQQQFPASATVYVNHAVPANSQWDNLITEFASIPSTNLEPGSVVKMRIFRDGANAADTHTGDASPWKLSLKYQKARIGTRNRTPDFYI